MPLNYSACCCVLSRVETAGRCGEEASANICTQPQQAVVETAFLPQTDTMLFPCDTFSQTSHGTMWRFALCHKKCEDAELRKIMLLHTWFDLSARSKCPVSHTSFQTPLDPGQIPDVTALSLF